MSMGMVLNLDLLWANPLGAIGFTLVLMTIKVAVLLPLARLAGLPGQAAMAVALLLAQSGEFGLILFALAAQNKLLAVEVQQFLLLAVLLSMLLTPALALMAQRMLNAGDPSQSTKLADLDHAQPGVDIPVVLAGFGRVGHRIGEILTRAGVPFLALDSDPALVARERAKGNPVYYGDLRQSGVLMSAGVANARLIIVTLNDVELTRKLVAALRTQYPNLRIFARGHNMEACQSLHRLGAAGVVSENAEASLELSRMAMDSYGIEATCSAAILDTFRQRYHEQIHNSHGDVENQDDKLS
jgi:hypothetical protein